LYILQGGWNIPARPKIFTNEMSGMRFCLSNAPDEVINVWTADSRVYNKSTFSSKPGIQFLRLAQNNDAAVVVTTGSIDVFRELS
jgi:hypothetical protein